MITDYIKRVNDRAYIVKKEVSTHAFELKGKTHLNMELLKAYRDYLGCNHVLRTPTHFLMCEEIEDAQVL
ncbi:MAG: hypothetical protein GY936_15800 [Ignavibacteriae bacterium]|nr:hypothetical protein [Ignavibacteriota bacterium]